MEHCFIGDKEGRAASQRYEEEIKTLVEEELKKYNLPLFNSKEERDYFQEALRSAIEERIKERVI